MLWRERGWVYGALKPVFERRTGATREGGDRVSSWDLILCSARAAEVSAEEKLKALGALGSTGPADSGGVAVIVLGKFISSGRGEVGWADKGVSGYDAT